MTGRRFPYWVLFPLAAALLLWPVLFGGQVLLPAEYLKAFTPWKQVLQANPDQLPQWNVLQWDGLAQFYPWRLYLARSFSEGRIPLWNPYAFCGTPFLANSQSAPLYPLHALLALPVGAVANRMAWLDFIHLSFAGLFAFLLARFHGVRPIAAAVAGLAYELSGFAVAWLELPSFITVACWIPLLLLCLTAAIRHSSWRWACGGGLATGMMMLGGHLQIAFYGLLAAGLVWVWEALSAAQTREARAATLLRCVGIGTLVVACGVAMSAAQLLPSIELSRVSHRVGAPTEGGYTGYVSLAMPVQNWITLLVPDFYGLPGHGDFWGFWNPFAAITVEYAGFAGAAVFVLALVGLLAVRKVRGSGAWLLIGGVALLLATGTPLNRLFYFFVPGFAQSGSPARCLVLFCLAQAMLAAIGLDRLLTLAEADWRRSALNLAGAAAVTAALIGGLRFLALANLPANLETAVNALFSGATVSAMTARVSDPAALRAVLMAAGMAGIPTLLAWLLRDNRPEQRLAGIGGACVAVAAGSLLFTAAPYNPTAPADLVYPLTPVTDALVASGKRVATINRDWDLITYANATLPPNASLAYGWRDAQGYDSLALGHYRRLIGAVAAPAPDAGPPANGNIAFVKNPTSPLLPLLAAPLVVSGAPVQAPGLRPAAGFGAGTASVYEVVNAVPEGYTVSDWFAADDGAAIDRLRSLPTERLRDIAAVAPGPEVPHWDTSHLRQAGKPGVVERLGPHRIRVTGEPELPSLMVLAEGFAPGWRVSVQDQGRQPRSAPILRTNVGFQGVLVGSGKVTAEWRYEPASFRVGLWISLAALTVLIGGIAAGQSAKGTGSGGRDGEFGERGANGSADGPAGGPPAD
jgi:hypothetical protein